jgi:hypothetical protein
MKKPKTNRRSSRVLGWAIILSSIVLGYLWMQNATSAQKEKIASLEGLSAKLSSETVPMKFMILSRDKGEIKARLKIYDLSGNEVSVMEKSWAGAELYIDVLLIPVKSQKSDAKADSWLAFPYRIFTDKVSASSGTMLFDSYDSGGFPEVLRGVTWTTKDEAAIKSAFADARAKAKAGLPAADAVKGAFGSAAHEISHLASFEEGVVYKVVCRVKGGVEIMEDR